MPQLEWGWDAGAAVGANGLIFARTHGGRDKGEVR